MILDLFAGSGGWDVGARQLGMDPQGIENDDAARATRKAAGLRTGYAKDVRTVDLATAWNCQGLIASPPCQTFSMAGKGAGRVALEQVLHGVKRVAAGEPIPYDEYDDLRTGLVLEPLRYALELEPEWIAWEQVPTVQPVWEACAEVLREDGYHVWTGHLHAEQYGVPQTRKRSVLIASRSRTVGRPAPTHSRFYSRNPAKLDEGVAKWVSMAEALGWHPSDRVVSNYGTGGDPRNRGERTADLPSVTVTSKIDRNIVITTNHLRSNATVRDIDQPAPTITGGKDFEERRWVTSGMLSAGGNNTAGQILRTPEMPSATLTGKGTAYWQLPDGREPWKWAHTPATTIQCDPRITAREHHYHGEQNSTSYRVTVQEAAVLQSFPPDYPWDGLATAPHVAQCLSVEDHKTLAHKLVSDGLQRGVHLTVRGLVGKDNEVLQAVVVLDAVDVVDNLLRLRPGDLAVLRYKRTGAEDVATVQAEAGGLLATAICVERITVEPPLLPVLGAEAASDGFAFAVQARVLPDGLPGVGAARLAEALVVHEAEAVRRMLPVAVLDAACTHKGKPTRWTGNSKTKQYQQVGNAIPPLLALHVLSEATGIAMPAVSIPHDSVSGPTGWRVRSSMGEPKVDGRNGTHEFDPFNRPAHTVTTKTGEWQVLRPHDRRT